MMGSTIFGFGSEKVRVQQHIGTDIRGEHVERFDREEFVRMHVQPISPSERKLLPEGTRTMDSICIYTTGPLVHEETPGRGNRSPDRIFWGGFWWRVVADEDWSQTGGYVMSVAVRENDAWNPGESGP